MTTMITFASGVGGMIGPVAGSYIYEKIGNNIVFYIKGALMVAMVSVICYIYINKIGVNKEEKTFRIIE